MDVQARNVSDKANLAARLVFIVVLATVMVAALTLVLRTESRARSESVSVGLVTDGPTVDDQSFNWMSYQGLLRAESQLGVSGTVYTSTDSADYKPNLQQCVDDGKNLCVSVGFSMADATLSAAEANSNTQFAIVDESWESYPDNLRGMVFAADEVGYMAGALAGLMTDSDLVGAIGGMPIPAVDNYIHGYRNGAQCSNPDATVAISYTNDFSNPALGAESAQDMITQGADVIFAPAAQAGVEAVLTATQSGAWGIGVDTDYYHTVFEDGAVAGFDRLLSSAMKRVDDAVFDTIQDVVSDTFTSGTELYDLENEGVGLAPFHDAGSSVGQDVRDRLEAVEDGIISGTIDVADPCRHFVYLPAVVKNDSSSTESFKLAVLGPFSGSSSRTGEEFKAAVNMAFDSINWQIGHYKIEPVWIDSESDRTKAMQNYEDAIVGDGVEAGLLNWHSSVAVGCMDVVAEHQVPHFAGFGATEVVNETFNSNQDKYGYWTTKWWPTPSKLNISYVQMLEHAIDSGHWSPSEKTVAIYGEDTDWGRAFGDGIKANFEDAGWTVIAEEYFPYGQTDFTTLMTALNGLNPAVVAGTTTSGDSAAAFINEADATGLNSVIIVDGLGWTGNWYSQTGGSSDHIVDQIPGWASAESQDFKQAFEARYGYSPSPSSGGLAYDATNFFISVAQATYEQYGELSSEALYNFTQNQIWTGQWTYTDGVMMEEYKYTSQSIPDPVVGDGYYTFPVLQYFDGEGEIVFPPSWADQPFTPPGS